MIARFLCILLIIFSADEAYAKNTAAQDDKILAEAFAALEAGNFAKVVSKASRVIDRFEKEKDANSKYVCTSASPDLLVSLFSAISDNQKNDGTTSHTVVALPNSICLAYFLKGFALVDMQQREEALPNLEMALKLDPDNQHYANELAEWYKIGGQWEKSLERFTVASEITDMSIATMEDQKQSSRRLNDMRCRSYRGIAFNHVELKNWTKARDAIEQCLKLIPGDPKSMAEIAYINSETGG